MESEPARDKFFVLAIPAFVNGQIAEPLKQRSMDPFEFTATTESALAHCACYTSICAGGTTRAKIKESYSPTEKTYDGPYHGAWRAPAQFEERPAGNPPE